MPRSIRGWCAKPSVRKGRRFFRAPTRSLRDRAGCRGSPDRGRAGGPPGVSAAIAILPRHPKVPMTVAWARWVLYDRRTRSVDTDRHAVKLRSRQSRWFDGVLVAAGFYHQPACRAICVPDYCPGTRSGAIGFGRSGIQANVRPARAPSLSLEVRPRGSRPDLSYLNFIFTFCRSGVVLRVGGGAALRHSTQERAMQRVFIIAIMFLGITAAQGQTVMQPSGHTNSSIGATNSGESALGSDPLGVSTSSLSGSSTSPSSQSGTVSGSPAATGPASGGAGATSSGSGAAAPVRQALKHLCDCRAKYRTPPHRRRARLRRRPALLHRSVRLRSLQRMGGRPTWRK